MRATERIAVDSLCVGLASFLALTGVFLWMDNVHLGTMNGLWKSIQVEAWKESPSTANLDSSNYLYFPLAGLLCSALEVLGVYAGKTWKQLALLNVVFGAVNLVTLFVFVRWFTNRRDAAYASVLLAFGCGFFLVLATTNEDIMPTFTTVFIAMALAAAWFSAPSARQVAVVGAIFTLGWLGEWRLLFPTLPALLLALAVAKSPWQRRAWLALVLIVSILATAFLVVIFWNGHSGAVGLADVLWTGKGIATGWAGFSWEKMKLLPVGIGEYLIGGRQISAKSLAEALMFEWAPAFIIQLILFMAVLVAVWFRREDPRTRAVAAIFLGTLGAGQVMNAYSQPQDPQMQINVMVWLPVAWGAVVALLATSPTRRLALLALSVVPFAYNVTSLSPRGADSAAQAALAEVEKRFDPARTVFVYSGWENIVAWKYLVWTHRWGGVCDLPSAPAAQPKFKWIHVLGGAINHPTWSSEQDAAALKAELECAFDKGYKVIAADVWRRELDDLSGMLITLNASNRGPQLYALMHESYDSVPAGRSSLNDQYYEITRKVSR